MIINFSVQNFGCIKDKQTLSFEADKSTHLEDYYVITTSLGLRLLKLGLIYGANASGKTTIIKALNFLREIVNEPKEKKTDTFNFSPFLFDEKTPDQNTIFSIEFIQKDKRYFYEVELNKKAIIKEELYFYNPRKTNIYKRTTDVDKQYTHIEFSKKIKNDKTVEKILEASTLWNNTVLGGFLKINMEFPELKDVSDWFKFYLFPPIITNSKIHEFSSNLINLSQLNENYIINILKKADFNISGIHIEKKDYENNLYLEFEHTVNNLKYKIPSLFESQGSIRYYGFAGFILTLIQYPILLPIDELETSLHPDLYLHFLMTFLVNSKQSQLIATTHNREILNNKDIFRNDAIWFTEKNEHSATELYSLSDFVSSVIRDTSNIYNAYKSGKLGAIPNLGDYYINLNDENTKE